MRGSFFAYYGAVALLVLGLAGPAVAVAIDQPFPTMVEGEALAAQAVPQPASPTAVSATQLGLVKGVVVVLNGSAGYDRDSALALAAKKALPTVLERLPMAPETAKITAKAVGDAQKFVKSYTIVKESLLPQYQLTADLLFDEAMLRKNFGGKILKQELAPVAVSATNVTEGAVSSTLPVAEEHTLTVVIATNDPATVDRMYARLAGTAAKVSYAALSNEDARLTVKTALTIDTIAQLVAPEATVEMAPPEGPALPEARK